MVEGINFGEVMFIGQLNKSVIECRVSIPASIFIRRESTVGKESADVLFISQLNQNKVGFLTMYRYRRSGIGG